MSRITAAESRPGRSAVFAVILAACLVALIGFGIRSSFGLYLDPMTAAKGWSRETFALAMAIQTCCGGSACRSRAQSRIGTGPDW